MSTASLRCLAFLAVLLQACGDARDAPTVPAGPASLPGVWTGVFPCDDCPGIDVTLWVRPDERFFIEQRYRPGEGENDGTPATAYALGRWRWNAGERVLVLDGEGPDRIFAPDGADALLMRTLSPLEHRLRRDAAAPEFGATIRLRGVARRQGDAYVFEECLTGYELPVDTGGDYARFRRHYRSLVPRGAAAPVELEGSFTWAADGAPASFRIDRFITIRNEGGCTNPSSTAAATRQ